MRLLLACFGLAWLVVPGTALGVELNSVALTPVSVEIRARAQSSEGSFGQGPDQRFEALPATSSASIAEPFDIPGLLSGNLTASTDVGDGVTIDLAASNVFGAGRVMMMTEVVFDLPVPALGASDTTIYLHAEVVEEVGTASFSNPDWLPSNEPLQLLSVHAQGLGAPVHLDFQDPPRCTPYSDPWTRARQCERVRPIQARNVLPLTVPAGENLRIHFQFWPSNEAAAATNGSFSYTLRFRALVPPLEAGAADVNGDGAVDVLDVAVLRRVIAGLPVP